MIDAQQTVADALADVDEFLDRARTSDSADEAKDWALAAKNAAGVALALVQAHKTARAVR